MPLAAFVKRVWANAQSGGTPADATALNRIEDGVYAVTETTRTLEALAPVGTATQSLDAAARAQARTNIAAIDAPAAQSIADAAVAASGAGSIPASRQLTTSMSSSTTTPTVVPGLEVAVTAGTYLLEVLGTATGTSATTTEGGRFGVGAPAGSTLLGGWVEQGTSTAVVPTTLSGLGSVAGVQTNTGARGVRVVAAVQVTTAGTVAALFARAGTAGFPNLQAGTVLRVTKLP